MSLILPGDYAAQATLRAHEVVPEVYEGLMVDNVIPRVAEVMMGSEMSNGLYHRCTQELGDDVPAEREMGTQVDPGNTKEGAHTIIRKRFIAKKYAIPREFFEHGQVGPDTVQNWAASKASHFAQKRFEAEQLGFWKLFNNGGLTAGHAAFDNSVPDLVSDPGGKLLYDSKPLFNLTGNARTAPNGTTYYNGVALSLTHSNWVTLDNLVADTNGYTETGDRLDTMPNVIIVPTALRHAALAIRDAAGKAGVADNDANTLKSYDVVVVPHLTDADAWFLMKARMGIVYVQDDRPPTVEFKYDADMRTDVMVIQSVTGAGVKPSGWRFIGASNFATS